jgi:hypothetical protein
VAAADTLYQTPFGDFLLRRYPARRDDPLQAWCGADTLLLEEIHRLGWPGGDVLDYGAEPPDLILCNPPFHLNHAVDEYAGRRLLAQCARQLPAGGRLCLVANRHLKYLPTLRRHFRRIGKIAQDQKFIVWLAEKV